MSSGPPIPSKKMRLRQCTLFEVKSRGMYVSYYNSSINPGLYHRNRVAVQHSVIFTNRLQVGEGQTKPLRWDRRTKFLEESQ